MELGRFVRCAIVTPALMMFLDTNSAAQIMQIGQMNTQQIRALDLAKTVILMPGDILEETWHLPTLVYRWICRRRLYLGTGEGHRRKTRMDRGGLSPDSARRPAHELVGG